MTIEELLDNSDSMCIKHIRNTDVCFRVSYVDVSETDIFMLGYWINIIKPTNPFVIALDEISINKEDLCNWNLIDVGL